MSIMYPQLISKELMDEVNVVGYVRKTPLLLSGIFLELIRAYYSTIENLPVGVNYTWKPIPKISKASNNIEALKENVANLPDKVLLIEPEFDEKYDVLEKRPGICIEIDDIEYSNVDNSVDRNPRIGMDLIEGEDFYSRQGKTLVHFIHIGRTKGEALIFASATLDFLDAFSNVITRDFCFERFAPIKITKPQPIQECVRRYDSRVICALTFQDSWSLKLESPKLKDILTKVKLVTEKSEDELIATSCSFCNT